MKLLVLGGSGFVGRTFVDEARTSGWDVTVFNRGTAEAPPGVTALQGDRSESGGLAALETGEWDVIADTWSQAPYAVRDSAEMLADRVGRYIYVSSRSVYDQAGHGATETAAIVDGSAGDKTFDDYARAKAGGEAAAAAAFGDRALLLRAGLILGPHENIGRLPWWLNTIAAGGSVLAPGPAELPLQYIDARDLARWSLDAATRGLGGPYDIVSPPGHTTMGTLLRVCIDVTDSAARLVWTDPQAIVDAGVQPWTELPIWIPPGADHDMMHGSDPSKAAAAGLVCRPIEGTVRDTWEWLQALGGATPQRADRPAVGMSAAAMAKVLRETEPRAGRTVRKST